MNQILALIIALSFGLFMLLFERWYSKYRTQKVKQKGLNLISRYGFNISKNDYSNYERIVENYAISLSHIRKSNFFDRHTLRLMIDFKWGDSFEDLECFVSEQRNNHPQYKWVANSIFLDIEFYLLKKETFDFLEDILIKMIHLLKSQNLDAIDRDKGIQFGKDFDDWQTKN